METPGIPSRAPLPEPGWLTDWQAGPLPRTDVLGRFDTMLGVEPVGEHLLVDPALPRTFGHLVLLYIPGRWGRVDAFARGRVDTSAPARERPGR